MKHFISNMAASAIAGILLLIVGYFFTTWIGENQKKLTYEVDTAATFIGFEEVEALGKWADDKEPTAKIALLRIENSGNKALKNLKFTIRPTVSKDTKKIYGMGIASSYGGEILEPSITQDSFDFKLKIPLLSEDQGVVFWIAHQPPQGFELINENEEVEAEQSHSYLRDLDLYDDGWIDSVLSTLLLLTFGALIGLFGAAYLINKSLIKAGYDPSEIDAAYAKAIAAEKQAKKESKSE